MSKQSFSYISVKTLKLMLRTIQITLTLCVVLAALAFWRLSVAPVNVDFLVPKLTPLFLPAESGLKLHIDSIFLKTGFQKEGLVHVHINGLTLLRQDGTIIADIPETSMSYGLWNILTLNYLPDTMKIRRPVIQAVIDEEGRFFIRNPNDAKVSIPVEPMRAADIPLVLSADVPVQLVMPNPPADAASDSHKTADISLLSAETKVSSSTDESADSVLKQTQIRDVDAIIRYFLKFEQLKIENMALLLDDRHLNRSFSISNINALLRWPSVDEHTLSASGVVQSDGSSTKVQVKMSLNRRTKQVPFDISFDGLNLSKFASFIPILTKDTLRVGGRIFGQFDFSKGRDDIRKAVTNLSFELITKQPGRLHLPAPLTNEYHIQKAVIRGQFSPDLSALSLKDSTISLVSGGTAQVTAEVTGLGDFLDTFDPTLLNARLDAHVTGLIVDQTASVWPPELGPDAHAWVQENIFDGTIPKADFTLYFKGLELVDLFGRVSVDGASVRYVESMPVVRDVAGEVLLYPDKVEITAHQGKIGNLILQKAALSFTDLLADVAKAQIDITASGPIQEALDVIAAKPLEFPQMFGLDVARTSGMGNVHLILAFPLTDDLDLSHIQTTVSADLSEAVFPLPFGDERITDGTFNLSVDNAGLTLEGNAKLKTVPLTLKWQEFFTTVQQSDVQSVYDISSDVQVEFLKTWIPDVAEYATGHAPLRARVQKTFNNRYTYDIDADLKETKLILYPVATVKEQGHEAVLKLNGIYHPAITDPTFDFIFSAPKQDLSATGAVSLNKGFSLIIRNLIAPGTQVKGTVEIDADKNIVVKANGRSWNMTQLRDLPFLKKTNDETVKNDKTLQALFSSILLDVRLQSVLLKPGKPLKNVEIKGKRQGLIWQNMFMFAAGAKPFSAHYAPEKKILRIQSEDVGDLLDRLNVTDRFSKGRLNIEAKQLLSGGFKGTIDVTDFQFKDPGFFVQAVTILGIVDGIIGNELNFKKAQVPFETLPTGRLSVQNGYAYGTTLGVTFAGTLESDQVSLSGSVIPAYIINSLLGRIPLIGGLFKDGEGGGLVGVKYTISGSLFHPGIQFHPLASMAPGVLGTLFK